MPIAADKKALDLVRQCEAEGRVVRRIIIDGKRIELEFDDAKPAPTLDNVKW